MYGFSKKANGLAIFEKAALDWGLGLLYHLVKITPEKLPFSQYPKSKIKRLRATRSLQKIPFGKGSWRGVEGEREHFFLKEGSLSSSKVSLSSSSKDFFRKKRKAFPKKGCKQEQNVVQ